MLQRVLEPEVMDTAADACDYDQMDHSAVNRVFVQDFLAVLADRVTRVVDVGTGTAQIPIALCCQTTQLTVAAVDASAEMLQLARQNITRAGWTERISLHLADARRLPFPDRQAGAVMSNSIVHHIPEPGPVLADMVRVCEPGGIVFVRDLLRPNSEAELEYLVTTYTAGMNPHQRQLFADSLRAALTLAEVRSLVSHLGFAPETVQSTSDRHWTWSTPVP
ncbi:MAG: class I SAM-dependent methyltransferase [Bacteroidales bacterium]|nr:class I SAM-dependent methyltransferase [Bacteroidales bacterium]